MATLLTTIQDLCKRQNVPVPNTVYGSTDTQVKQMQALLEEEGDDLSGRYSWEGLINQASHTTTAAEDQGAISSIATNGFRYILNDTLWDRTRRLPVSGPLDPVQWQMLKALFVNGPYYQHRIRGAHLLVNPTPPASESWYFEYVSYNWIVDTGGSSYKQRFTADDDVILLPYNLVLQGLRWRWKKEKGFDYAEDFRTYEAQVANAMGRDGGKPVLHMDGPVQRGPVPGVFVSPGTWPL